MNSSTVGNRPLLLHQEPLHASLRELNLGIAKFDQQGDYVRHWVPELANLPAAWIHKPWMAPPAELAKAGVELESDYPLPVVDHDEARREALEGFERIHKPVRARTRG